MFAPLTLGLEMPKQADRLDPRVWRAALMCALARSNEGLVLCDRDLSIVYATARAVDLLERFGASERVLGADLGTIVEAQLAAADATFATRVVGKKCTLYVAASRINGVAPVHVGVWLREEVLRDDRLFASLKDRFGVSHRGFQLAQLVRRGLTNRQISDALGLTESTVKFYLHQLYRECGVSNRTSLIALIDEVLKGS